MKMIESNLDSATPILIVSIHFEIHYQTNQATKGIFGDRDCYIFSI